MVSVIIPTYNRRTLLKQAAASVLSQQYRSIELIIVDDGSTDGSGDTASEFLTDPRVVVKRIAHAGFPGAVRNAGVKEARGEWIAFLDSDDLWLPDRLQLQMDYSCSAGEDYRCIHGREIWLRGERVISQASQRHRRDGDIFFDSLKKCIIGPSTVLIDRDLFHQLGGFREDLEIAEDYEFWLRLTACEKVGYVNIPVVVKRSGYGEQQLSEKYGHIEGFRIRGLKELLENRWFSFDEEKHRLAAAELVRKCRIFAQGARKRGYIRDAEQCEQLIRQFSDDLSDL